MAESLRFDALVIGGGCAGAAAAIALKQRRKNVAVLASSAGATSVSSGAWDLGPVPAIPLKESFSYADIRGAAAWAAACRGVLIEGDSLGEPAEVKAALEGIAETFADDLKLSFSLDRALTLPTSAGRWKRTFGAQELQARADLAAIQEKRVALVASRQWRFPSELVAQSWKAALKDGGTPLEITPLWLELRGSDWPLPQLAARLLHDIRLKDLFREKLKAALQVTPYDVLLFPPLFLEPAYADLLGKDLGVTVAECLSTTEPIAGKRMTNAIAGTLNKLSIPFYSVTGLQADVSRGTVSGIRAGAMGASDFRASRFVLATGKGFAGGIRLGYEEIRETVFDLPVFCSRSGGRTRWRSEIAGKSVPYSLPQTWAQLGVWVDKEWRPIDPSGRAVFENVTACGSIIGGIDYARAGLGMGFMAWSGRQCGAALP